MIYPKKESSSRSEIEEVELGIYCLGEQGDWANNQDGPCQSRMLSTEGREQADLQAFLVTKNMQCRAGLLSRAWKVQLCVLGRSRLMGRTPFADLQSFHPN